MDELLFIVRKQMKLWSNPNETLRKLYCII